MATTLSQLGIPGAGFGMLHPKQKNRWQVTFSGLGRLITGASSRELTRQAVKLDRPSLKFQEIEIHRYNSTAYIAGKHSWETVNITFEDDITGLASAAVQAQLETQQRLIGADLSGNYLAAAATGSDYKFGMIMQQLDGQEGVVESWKLEGCFFASAKWDSLDYSNNGDAMMIDVTVRFDHARQELTGAGYGTALNGNL
jgi:hypothetical protein